MTVSLALIGVGVLAARLLHDGSPLHLARWHVAGGLAGGLLVVASFLLDAPSVLAGGVPRDYPWLLFVAGMFLTVWASIAALGRAPAAEVATTAS